VIFDELLADEGRILPPTWAIRDGSRGRAVSRGGGRCISDVAETKEQNDFQSPPTPFDLNNCPPSQIINEIITFKSPTLAELIDQTPKTTTESISLRTKSNKADDNNRPCAASGCN